MTDNWISFSESPWPWEREAIDFVRARFPGNDPWQGWSLFEFIALDGSLNEVDMLIFGPFGFFMVEAKSHPGRLAGDAGTWTFNHDGRQQTIDNPLALTNLKAKRLKDLLERQRAARSGPRIPFLEALTFVSDPDVQVDLTGNALVRLCRRDRDEGRTTDGRVIPARPGIMAALKQRECPGVERLPPRSNYDRPMKAMILRAMEQAGIRPSSRKKKVADYELKQQIDEGKGFQDWKAEHVSLPGTVRRIRIYPIRKDADANRRRMHERAAIREFQLIDNMAHPNILRPLSFSQHELGPAVIFEHDPSAIRLDHFLAQRDRDLPLATRLDLVRRLAEVIRFAHNKRVVHRSLSPRSILVLDAGSEKPRLKVFNWQAGYRLAAEHGTGPTAAAVTATSHVGMLVDDPTTAYMAPDIFAAAEQGIGEHLDVFSLGSVAYHILSGKPPAANGVELANTIRGTKGLQLAAVLDGANELLCEVIQYATHPEVSHRLESVGDFLELLDEAEDQLTNPDEEFTGNPAEAAAGDVLPGSLRVDRRIGQGSCSAALLVTRTIAPADQLILKVASALEHNNRVRAEARLLAGLAGRGDNRIVQHVEDVELGDHAGFLMRPAFADSAGERIETLGDRVRKDGPLHIDLLQRFGEDLIDVVRSLDAQGFVHRDIKPDNIAVGFTSREQALQIVLFDFSLASTQPDNIRAGTICYLDPMLPLRPAPPRYDTYAERYAVAATLHHMATGRLPRWGDGQSDPSMIEDEATIDADLFDPNLREPLAAFFRKAFRRNVAERFGNAEQMLEEWRRCFTAIPISATSEDPQADEDQLAMILATATWATSIANLGLGARAVNALDRANVLSVRDLLRFNRASLERMRGVGAKTRREITTAVRLLRERLAPDGLPADEIAIPSSAGDDSESITPIVGPAATALDAAHATEPESADPATMSIEALRSRLLGPPASGARGDGRRKVTECFLGLNAAVTSSWPTQTAVAEAIGLTKGRVSQLAADLVQKANRDPAVTALRTLVVECVDAQGGAATAIEVARMLVDARGSNLGQDAAVLAAIGLTRIAVDVEGTKDEPRTMARRDGNVVVIARSTTLADYASRLGGQAHQIATEDPLAAPARVLERLRSVSTPEGTMLADSRLVQLAAAASEGAAASSRMELYPRGMNPSRALKLSQGAIAGMRELTEPQLRLRVTSRYPDAQPLPARPELDLLLQQAGFDLTYDPVAGGGLGAYVSRVAAAPSVTSGSTIMPRYPTMVGGAVAADMAPEVADAKAFEERLKGALTGVFLKMVVKPRLYYRAVNDLSRRFSVRPIDVEQVVLDALRQTADELDVDWKLITSLDSDPAGPDWHYVRQLAERAKPRISEALRTPGETQLLIYPDILVRYGLLPLLADLRERLGGPDGPRGVWLLTPGGATVLIDGQPVGIPGPSAVIPDSWCANIHRTALS